jgi:hypothetical protein
LVVIPSVRYSINVIVICERSEAIQQLARRWIASSLSLLAMTTIML